MIEGWELGEGVEVLYYRKWRQGSITGLGRTLIRVTFDFNGETVTRRFEKHMVRR